jgi:hypothetical protein
MDLRFGIQRKVGKRILLLWGPYPTPFARSPESLLGLKKDGMLKL